MIQIKMRFFLGIGFGVMPIRNNNRQVEYWIVIAFVRILIREDKF